LLIVASSVAILLYGTIAAMLGTILPEISARLRITPRQNGTIAFAQALGLILASLAAGPLLDNEGKKAGMVLGLLLMSIALFALPKANSFRNVAFLLFLLGVGSGILVTGANSLASDVGESRRAVALNLVNVFFGIGAFATPFISANFFKRNSTRLCYTIASLTVVTLLIQAMTTMPAPTGSGRFVLTQVAPVLGRPLLLMTGLFLFLYITCEVGIWNWLPRHLIAQGIQESKALNILSFGFAIGMLVGRVGILPILRQVPPVTVTMTGSIAMAITTFAMLRTNRPPIAAILVFLAGVSMGPVFPTTVAIVGDGFPRMSSTAIAFVITCGWTGLAVSSHIIGAIAGGDPRRLKTALLVIPVSSVLMVALDLGIRSTVR
jgi:fucose permease